MGKVGNLPGQDFGNDMAFARGLFLYNGKNLPDTQSHPRKSKMLSISS